MNDSNCGTLLASLEGYPRTRAEYIELRAELEKLEKRGGHDRRLAVVRGVLEYVETFAGEENGEELGACEELGVEAAYTLFMIDARGIYRNADENAIHKTPTGIGSIDELTGGGLADGLHIITGRPGAYKTTLALTIARNVATLNPAQAVLFISLEMDAEEVYRRLEGGITGGGGMKYGNVAIVDNPTLKAIYGIRAMITDDYKDVDIDALPYEDEVLTEVAISMVIVDSLNAVDYGRIIEDYGGHEVVDKAPANSDEALEQVSRELSELGRRLGIPIVAIARNTKAGEGMTQVRGPADVVNVAESVIALEPTDDYGEFGGELVGVWLLKNRHGKRSRDKPTCVLECFGGVALAIDPAQGRER